MRPADVDPPPPRRPPSNAGAAAATGSTFRSLHNPRFRRYFVGQLASMCGSWAQTVAIAWLVLRLTDSGTRVGLVTATQFAPVVLLSAWAGSIADRVDQRRAVLLVQVVLGLQATVLATLVLTDTIRMWMLYPLALVQGVGVAFDTPSRQSLVGRIVAVEDLRNALSLNATLTTVARVVGPAAAGALIETVGIGACFAINAASYAVIFVAVVAIRVDEKRSVGTAGGRASVREGIGIAWADPALRNRLLMAFVVANATVAFTVALPVLVRQHFEGRAGTYGLLAAMNGVGGVVGSFISASYAHQSRRMIQWSMAGLAAGLLLCAQGTLLALLLPALVLAGCCGTLLGVGNNASLQILAPPAMRGRIIGLYFMIAFGSNVVGGPVVGWLSERLSARVPFALCAAAVILMLGVSLSPLRVPLSRAARRT